MKMKRNSKTGVVFSPRLRGAHRYTTTRVVCASPKALAEGGVAKTATHGGVTIPHRGKRAAPSP